MDEEIESLPEPEDSQDQGEESSPDKPMIGSKLGLAVLILVVVAVPIFGFLGIGMPADVDAVLVTAMEPLENGHMALTLDMESSALAYTMVTQKVEDRQLCISPRVSLSSFLHGSGQRTLETKVPLSELESIALKGSEGQISVIWPEKV